MWIEGELAKISENSEVSEESDMQEPQDQGQTPSASSYHEQIQDLYNRYVECRETCVTVVDVASAQVSTPLDNTTQRTSTGPVTAQVTYPKSVVNASKILSYVPALLQESRDEKELLQHTAHLRRQLAAASDETTNTLKRLADESHIVTPRSDSTHAWSSVAREATTKTEGAIDAHLTEGEKSVTLAKAILDESKVRSTNFQLLKGAI